GGVRWLPDKEIDDVLAPLVDQHGRRLTVKVIESAALQTKALVCKVVYRGSKIHLTVEPRLDGVAVRGGDVGYMRKQQLRADMAGHQFLDQQIPAGRPQRHLEERPGPECDETQRRRHRQPTLRPPAPARRRRR